MTTTGLKRIERSSTLEAVIRALRDYIIDSGLQSGDRLPTEHELSGKLGISRNIIREGMRYFRTLGIIESKPRVGAVIGRLLPEDPFGDYLPFLQADPDGIHEAAQMRQLLEYGAVPLIVRHCRAEDIEFLRRQTEMMSDARERLKAEIHFHTRLLEIPGNRLLSSMIPLTVTFFSRLREDRRRDPQAVLAEHREIVAALESKDEQRLAEAIKNHYRIFNRE